MNNNFTFYTFLHNMFANSNFLKIPEYQRDYAQGRLNKKVKPIRKSLVSDLTQALIYDDKQVELDFVFGAKEEDKKSFVLVDGQQRLTMLFLLHWYVFLRAGLLDADNSKEKELMKHFHYASRTTSVTFCENLLTIKKENIIWNKIQLSDIDFDEKDNENNNKKINKKDGKEEDEDKKDYLSENSLSGCIKNFSWFKGSMESDPTVKAMLVVLNRIHRAFYKKNDENFKMYAKKLKEDACPIRFYCVDLDEKLGGEDAIMDLYIKMNARGLPLTNFEIFKSKLQKENSEEDSERFDLLGKYLNSNAKNSIDERVKFIGKINTDYTNFLFNFFDCESTRESFNNDYDTAFYNLINEIFRIKFFTLVASCGVGQKTYRDDNPTIFLMTGREFGDFIENRGSEFTTKYKELGKTEHININEKVEQKFLEAFEDVISMLDIFEDTLCEENNSFYDEGEGYFYNVKDLLNGLKDIPDAKGKNNKGLGFPKILARHAIFYFIKRFDLSNECHEKNYQFWKTFVYRMVENATLKSFEDICESITGFDKILDIYEKSGKSIIEILSYIETEAESGKDLNVKVNFEKDNNMVKIGRALSQQLKEEKIKAKLCLKDAEWKQSIDEAHRYFKDGQIEFLLDMAMTDKSTDRIDAESYNLKSFAKCLATTKTIFDSDKKLKEYYSRDYLFERALYAADLNKYSFLSLNAYHPEIKKLAGNDFSKIVSRDTKYKFDDKEMLNNKIYDVVLSFIKDIPSQADECKKKLNSLIENYESENLWEEILVKHSVLGCKNNYIKYSIERFVPNSFEKNGIQKEYCAVYLSTNRISDISAEFCSLALAIELSKKHKKVNYQTSREIAYCDKDNNFPNRYFQIDERKTKYAYMKDSFWEKDESGILTEIGTFEEALEKLSKEN